MKNCSHDSRQHHRLSVVSYLFFLNILLLSPSFSQPNVVWVKVTFYDFHSDGSNPNFESFHPTGLRKGMIQDTLSETRKPLFKANLAYNDRVEEWFVPSGAGPNAVYDFVSHTWNGLKNYKNRPDEWIGQNFSPSYDLANVVVYDSLPFIPADPSVYPPGTYYFENLDFFPLDRKGFGTEPTGSGHNFGYTMEFHRKFQYRGGEFFHFYGDDDVWMFIDGHLVIDIGGVHTPEEQSVYIDDIAPQYGWQLGEVYNFDFFYCERHTGWAKAFITTNLINPIPKKLEIEVSPGTTIKVGTTLNAIGKIYADTGWIQNPPGDYTWGMIDPNSLNPISTFSYNHDLAEFIPIKAFTTVKIWAVYIDTVANVPVWLTDTVDITVVPGDPDHLVIEASPKKPQGSGLWNDTPLDEVIIEQNEDYNDKFYAILRDLHENWIGPANPVDTWTSDDPSLVTAETGPYPNQGQGKALRVTWAKSGDARVTALYKFNSKDLTDDLRVIVKGEQFSLLRAVYYETDVHPDGFIDLVNVVLSDNLDLTEDMLDILYNTITLPADRNFIYTRDDLKITDYGIQIKVSQDQGTSSNTAVQASDKLKIAETVFPDIGVILSTESPIIDSLGAVIIDALYCPNTSIINGNASDTLDTRDTLIVTFSEAIHIPNPSDRKPFDFLDMAKIIPEIFTMILKPKSSSNGKTMSFFVEFSEKPKPETGDSLRIDDLDRVEDLQNILQQKDTKWVLLKVKPYPFEIDIKAISPISLGNLILSQEIIDKLHLPNNQEGTLVIAELSGNVTAEEISGKLALFDPIGNSITENIQGIFQEFEIVINGIKVTHKVLYFLWDARNRNKRLVGPSTYMGIVKVKKNGETVAHKRVFIGVKE